MQSTAHKCERSSPPMAAQTVTQRQALSCHLPRDAFMRRTSRPRQPVSVMTPTTNSASSTMSLALDEPLIAVALCCPRLQLGRPGIPRSQVSRVSKPRAGESAVRPMRRMGIAGSAIAIVATERVIDAKPTARASSRLRKGFGEGGNALLAETPRLRPAVAAFSAQRANRLWGGRPRACCVKTRAVMSLSLPMRCAACTTGLGMEPRGSTTDSKRIVVPVGTAVNRQDERTSSPRTIVGSSGKAACDTDAHEEENSNADSLTVSLQVSTKSRSASGHGIG
eukprot:scaffold3641_cov32-Tisochrysis_lutea.AAC.7